MRIIRSVRWAVLGLMLVASVCSFAGVFVSVGFGPPALPVYVQPPCPQVGFIWTPGYWGNGPDGYFWVPGTWVAPPQAGLLWTPGYWGWGDGAYAWHGGYWGNTIGFYGGVNYGFGYGGVGYEGGYWRGGSFYYNRSVNNVTSIHVTNVYNKTVVVNNNHVAFNGGEGGVQARPTPAEERAASEHHIEATPEQSKHETAAASNRQLLASVNHGKPAIAATARPAEFKGRGVVAAKAVGAPYKAPPAHAAEAKPASPSKPANNAHPTTAARNNAPRPPAATNKATAPKPENNARPAASEHAATPARNVPRPPSNTNKESAARPANTPRPAPAEHTAAPARNEAAARPAPKPAAPRPSATPRQSAPPARNEAAARPAPAPRPAQRPSPAPHQSAPPSRPPAASHAAPSHPAEKPKEENHPKGR